MKRIFSVIVAVMVYSALSAQITPAKAWSELYPAIEKGIVCPTFRNVDYAITDFGAVAGEPAKLAHHAINKAIERCSKDGGGRVVVPAGVWHLGPITLLSNVNLHLSQGATLLFVKETKEYPLVLTRWEGMDCYNYQPMIYAYGEHNIAITGKGIVDGGATKEDWWAMCGAVHYGWKEGVVSQRIGRKQLMAWNEAQTPVEERIMGDGYGMRVPLINIYKCKNILIEDVTLLRSPFWVLHPLLSENLIVRRVHIENNGPNGDGCDPESCKNVLIEDCYFDTGDDCVAIKSGRNADGLRWNVPSENIIVRGCKMKNGHGGVVIGSEISGGYKNLFVERCEMDSPKLDRVIRIKTNDCRGGIIENIFVRDVQVGECKEAVLKINLVYEAKEICKRGNFPVVRNVNLERVNCKKSKYGVMITAYADKANVEGVTISDSRFDGVTSNSNFIGGKVKGVKYSNLYINGSHVKK